MKQYYIRFWLCLLTLLFLLTACGKQAAEDPLPTDMSTHPTAQTGERLDEGELPQVTFPQQTQPVTDPTEGTKPPEETNPSEDAAPPEETDPSEGTTPPETMLPPETSRPTVPAEPPRFDEDELPLIPVG
jgi:hypothetical protein